MDNDDLAGRRQSIIELKLELPPYTNSKINEMLNGNGTAGVGDEEFVSTVRTSIVDCLWGRDNNNEIISDEQRGLTTTIVDKETWPKEEKRIETALRLFPDILLEEKDGYNLIQWLSMRCVVHNYNLKNISLISLVIELGFELHQFDDELRGGLLSLFPGSNVEHGTWNTLQQLICYHSNENENDELRDDCFSAVRNWMRENNYLVNEDIHRYNLVGNIFGTDTGFVLESRLHYLINMDPVSLSLPCDPENGNCLPIYYSTVDQTIHTFNIVLQAGMQHFPDKFGFVFCQRKQTDAHDCTRVDDGTAFQFACKKYGHEAVTKVVFDCLSDYYCHQCGTITSSPSLSTSSTTTTTTTTATRECTESSLLMSAITDETIHLDGLYILLRKDPEAALLKLKQQLVLSAAEVVIPPAALTNVPIEQVAAVAAIIVPVATVAAAANVPVGPTVDIAAFATAAVPVGPAAAVININININNEHSNSSTSASNNDTINNNCDAYDEHDDQEEECQRLRVENKVLKQGDPTDSSSSSSSSTSVNGKKRKQYEMS